MLAALATEAGHQRDQDVSAGGARQRHGRSAATETGVGREGEAGRIANYGQENYQVRLLI